MENQTEHQHSEHANKNTAEHNSEKHTPSHQDHPAHETPKEKSESASKIESTSAPKITGRLNDVLEILKLNEQKILEVSQRKEEGSRFSGLYFLLGTLSTPVGGLLLGLSFIFSPFSFGQRFTLFFILLSYIVLPLFFLYINFLVAKKLFKAEADFSSYFRVMGYAMLLNILSIFPFTHLIIPLIIIWLLVVNYKTLKTVTKIDANSSIISIIITLAICWVVFLILTSLILKSFFFSPTLMPGPLMMDTTMPFRPF